MKVLIKRIKNYVSKSKYRAEKFSILRMFRNLFQLFFCRITLDLFFYKLPDSLYLSVRSDFNRYLLIGLSGTTGMRSGSFTFFCFSVENFLEVRRDETSRWPHLYYVVTESRMQVA